MNTRVDEARRLELTRPTEEGDLVFGQVSGFKVGLEGEPPFTAFIIDLGRSVPLAHLTLRVGERNDPDVVRTGDAEFDDAIEVLATPGNAPTLTAVLDAPTRVALREFFRLHPFAQLEGSSLRVPCERGVGQSTVQAAVSLARALVARFAAVGRLAPEAPPELPPEALTLDLDPSHAERFEPVPEEPVDPTAMPAELIGVGVALLSALVLKVTGALDDGLLVTLSAGLGLVAAMAWRARQR